MNERQIREALAEASAEVERRKRRRVAGGLAVAAPAVLGAGLLVPACVAYGASDDCTYSWRVQVELRREFEFGNVTVIGACSAPEDGFWAGGLRILWVPMHGDPGDACDVTAEQYDGTQETQRVVVIRAPDEDDEDCRDLFDPSIVRFE